MNSFKTFSKTGFRYLFFVIFSFILFYFLFVFLYSFSDYTTYLLFFLFKFHPFLIPTALFFFSVAFVFSLFFYIRFLYFFFQEASAPTSSGVSPSSAGLGYRNLPLNFPPRHDFFPLVSGDSSEVTNLSRVLDPVMLSDLTPYPHVPFHPEAFSDLQSLPSASTHFDFGKFFGFKDGLLTDYALEWAFVLQDRFTALEPQEVEWYYEHLREEMRMPLGFTSLLIRGKGLLEMQDELETQADYDEEMDIFQASLPYGEMDQQGIGLALPTFDLDSLISLTDDANSLVLKRIRTDRFFSYKSSDYLVSDEFRDLRYRDRLRRWRYYPGLNFYDRFGHFYINSIFVRKEKHNLLGYRRLRRFALAQSVSNSRLRRTLRSRPALWTGFAPFEQSAFIDLINILSPFHLSAVPPTFSNICNILSPPYRDFHPRILQPPTFLFYDHPNSLLEICSFLDSFSKPRYLSSWVLIRRVRCFFSPLKIFDPQGSFKKELRYSPHPEPYPFYTETLRNNSNFVWAQIDDFIIFWLPYIIAYCQDFIGFNLHRARSLRLDSAGRFVSPISLVPNDYRKSRFFKSVLKPVLNDSGPLSENGSLSHFFRSPAPRVKKRFSFGPWRFSISLRAAKSIRNRLRSNLFLLGGRTLLGLNKEIGSDFSALGDSDLRYYTLFTRNSLGNLHFSLSAYRSRQTLILAFALHAWLQRFGLFSFVPTFRAFLVQLRPLLDFEVSGDFLPRSVTDYFILEIYYFHLTQLLGRCPSFLELLRHFFLSRRARKSLILSPRYVLSRYFYRTPLSTHVIRSFLNPSLRPCVERFDSRAWKEIEPYSIVSHRAYHGGWYRSPFWESNSVSFFQEQFFKEIESDSVGLRYFETFCTTLDSDDYLSVQQLLFDRLARSQLSIVADGRPLEYEYNAKYFENFRRYYLCHEIFKPWYQLYWEWRVLFEQETRSVLYAHNYIVRAWTQSIPLAMDGFQTPSQFSFSRATLQGKTRGSRRPSSNLSPIPVYEPNYVFKIPGGSFGRSRVLDLGLTTMDPFEDYLLDTNPLAVRTIPSSDEFRSIFDLSHFVSQTYNLRDLPFPFFSRGFSELPSPVGFFQLLSTLNNFPRPKTLIPLSRSLATYAFFAGFRSFAGFLPFWFFRSQSLFKDWYSPRFPSVIPAALTTSGQPLSDYISALTKHFDTRSLFNAQDFSAYNLDGELFRALSILPDSQRARIAEELAKSKPDPKVEEERKREEDLDRHATLLSYYFDLFGPGPLCQVTSSTKPVPLSSLDLDPKTPPLLHCANVWLSTRGDSFPANLFTSFVGPVFDNFRWLLGYPLSHGLNFPHLISNAVHRALLDHPDTQAVLDTLPRRRFDPYYRPRRLTPPSLTPEEYWTALKDLVFNPSLNPRSLPYSGLELYWERLYASFFFHYRFHGTFPDWAYSDGFPSFPELEPVRRIGTFLKEFSHRVRRFNPEMGLDPDENKKDAYARPTLPSVPRLEDFGLDKEYAAYLYEKFDEEEEIGLYGLHEINEYSVAEARYLIAINSPDLPLLNVLLKRYSLPSPPEDIAHYLVDPGEYRYPARCIQWLQSVYYELSKPSRQSDLPNSDFYGYESRIVDFFYDFRGSRPLPKDSSFTPIPRVSLSSQDTYALHRFKLLYASLSSVPFARYYVERQKAHFQTLRPTLLFFRSDSFRPLSSYYAYRTNSQEFEGGEYPYFFRNFLALDEANRYENQDEDMEDDEEDEEIEIILTEDSQDSSEPDEFGDIEDVEELEMEVGVDEPYLYKNTRARFYDWVFNPSIINDGYWDFDFSNRQRRHYKTTLRHTTIGGLDEDEEHFGSTLFYYRGNYDEYLHWEDDDIDEDDTEDDELDTIHDDEDAR